MASERVIWLSEQRVGSSLVARIGRRGNDLLAEFPGTGVLTVNLKSSRASFEPARGAHELALKKINASLVAALLRHLRGGLTLHGSATSIGESAVAFVGPSGAGKSTMAAALCARPDTQLVADDTVAFELDDDPSSSVEVDVSPTQAEAWLLPDALRFLGFQGDGSEKIPVSLRNPTNTRLSLRAIVGLVFDARAHQPTMRSLRGHEAFQLLSSSVIRFVIDDPAAQAREFEQLRRVAQCCKIWELRRPRSLRDLETSIELVGRLYHSRGIEEGDLL